MAEGVSCHVLDAAPFFLSTSRHTLRKALNFALATSCAFLERRTDLTLAVYAALSSGGLRFLQAPCKIFAPRHRRNHG